MAEIRADAQTGPTRKLQIGSSLSIELENMIYALDSTSSDFPVAHSGALFSTAKSAAKVHTLRGLRSNIPGFIALSDGKMARAMCSIFWCWKRSQPVQPVEGAAGLR